MKNFSHKTFIFSSFRAGQSLVVFYPWLRQGLFKFGSFRACYAPGTVHIHKFSNPLKWMGNSSEKMETSTTLIVTSQDQWQQCCAGSIPAPGTKKEWECEPTYAEASDFGRHSRLRPTKSASDARASNLTLVLPMPLSYKKFFLR